jgi:hypothetical protein
MYSVWAVFYILSTSFIAMNGSRYFSLLDDAMISMRYAWNFSHGMGLVWNAGEYIEGYTNLLTTLLMSLVTFFFDKKISVAIVQFLGIPTVLFTAWTAKRIFDETNPLPISLFSAMAYMLAILYYPLSYWSLFGMETGLLSVLSLSGVVFTLRWLKDFDERNLRLLALCWGLSFLARNDALIIIGISYLYLLWSVIVAKRYDLLKKVIWAGVITALFVCGQTLFRWVYYGDVLPNTYYLKLGKIPLTVRVNDGLLYSWDFFQEHWILLSLAAASVLLFPSRNKWYLASLISGALFYQMWVGGDSWGRWRFVTPVIPHAVVLVSLLLVEICAAIKRKMADNMSAARFAGALNFMLALLVSAVLAAEFLSPYYREVVSSQKVPDVIRNNHNVNVAIALEAITTPDATIGVFWAGSIPYYTGRYSIDFLGKSDRFIADLYPWLPSKVVWFEKTTLPGHNKYDLFHSIKDLQPTYIQKFWYGEQTLRTWGTRNYVRFEYKEGVSTYTLIVKKDSPDVNWERGTIIPWGNDE